ncbi:hypothetical protein ACSBR2_036353 [Camellia fascicularis]
MVHQSGGYENVGFIHRDLHNQFQAERKVQLAEGDAEGALGYLSAELDANPLFFSSTMLIRITGWTRFSGQMVGLGWTMLHFVMYWYLIQLIVQISIRSHL